MPLPYEKLTQILGIEASDYPPEHETTPEFMNKKFNELLLNDKELLKQINDCFKVVGDGGYKSALDLGINNKNKSLKYNGFNWADVPSGKSGVWGDMWTICGNSITVYFKQNNQNTIYYRTINNNAWVGDWQQIATTTKTSFSLGAGTGYTIISQDCYIQNGQTYINALIKKTDGSAFGTGNLYIAASNTIPAGVFPCASIGYKSVSGETVSSAIPNFIQATVASKNIMISNTVADLKAIAINAIIG